MTTDHDPAFAATSVSAPSTSSVESTVLSNQMSTDAQSTGPTALSPSAQQTSANPPDTQSLAQASISSSSTQSVDTISQTPVAHPDTQSAGTVEMIVDEAKETVIQTTESQPVVESIASDPQVVSDPIKESDGSVAMVVDGAKEKETKKETDQKETETDSEYESDSDDDSDSDSSSSDRLVLVFRCSHNGMGFLSCLCFPWLYFLPLRFCSLLSAVSCCVPLPAVLCRGPAIACVRILCRCLSVCSLLASSSALILIQKSRVLTSQVISTWPRPCWMTLWTNPVETTRRVASLSPQRTRFR